MMKKSAKFIGILLSAVMVFGATSLTACGDPAEKPTPKPTPDDPPSAHTHTFSTTEWKSDDTRHWRPATCEHTTEKGSVADHDSDGENDSCSVCGHAHQHTFGTEWDTDDYNHWHSASCIHYELTKDMGEHNSAGANGSCSECGYTPHVHTYDTNKWTTNELAHWHAATCDDHVYRTAADSAYHTYDSTFKCTVCDYQHKHPVNKYKAVDETGHWDVWDCIHQDITNKLNFEAHDTDGDNGSCSTCGWQEIVPEVVKDASGNVTNWHTHKIVWEYNVDSHWKKLNCGSKEHGNKSCDKGFYAGLYRNFDMGPHTYGADGACTECGYNYKASWRYGTADCIACDVCGGCIKTYCVHETEAGHKKCGDARGADAKSVTLEAEEGEVWSREDGKTGSVADYTNGKRECIHASYSNVAWTITVNKATTVTLKIHCGRTADMFSGQGSVVVNGKPVTTNTPCGNPDGEDAKCNPAWLTFGCVELKAGRNNIEIYQAEKNGFHLDKIELVTDKDVTVDYTPINNTWIYSIGQYVLTPRAEASAAALNAYKQSVAIIA